MCQLVAWLSKCSGRVSVAAVTSSGYQALGQLLRGGGRYRTRQCKLQPVFAPSGNTRGCEMAWTYSISDVPMNYSSCDYEIHAVTVGDYIYVFGFTKISEENCMEVLVLDPKTSTCVAIPSPTSEDEKIKYFSPDDGKIYFAAAVDHNVYVCIGTLASIEGRVIHVFDTKSNKWSCKITYGDVPWGNFWLCTSCVNEGCVYTCGEYDGDAYGVGWYMWSFKLHTLQWEIVAKAWWIDDIPRFMVPYKNRIYVLLCRSKNHDIDSLTYIDLSTKIWKCLESPGIKPFSIHSWLPFAHGHYLYVLLGDMWLDYNIVTTFGNRKMNEVVLRYSFARDEWEQVYFKGIPPSEFLSFTSVVENIVVLFARDTKKAHVLDFLPTLRSICFVAVRKYKLRSTWLPATLQQELSMYRKCSK